jgi:hypothetical protein
VVGRGGRRRATSDGRRAIEGLACGGKVTGTERPDQRRLRRRRRATGYGEKPRLQGGDGAGGSDRRRRRFFLREERAAGGSSLRGRSDGETVVGFGLRGNGTGRGRLDQRRWTAVRPSLFLLGIGMEE